MRLYIALLGVSVIAALAGCAGGPPVSTSPEMTFANLQPLAINAAGIEVVDNYKPPLQDPNVEHTFHTPPYVAAERLLRKQLVAAGSENVLRAVIEDASVMRVELPGNTGFLSYALHEPAIRLKARVLVRFELINPQEPGIVLGHAQVIADREKTLVAGISPANRDRAEFSLTEDLMNDLNNGMNSIVVSTFGKRD